MVGIDGLELIPRNATVRKGTQRLWHYRTMLGTVADPPTLSQDSVEATYGQSYLEWKGWHENNFAKLEDLQVSYFEAELGRAGHTFAGTIKVLEIGFGNGSFLAYARRKGWEATGTEVNSALVDTAARLGFNAIHADDVNELREGSFDLVVAFDVLEHIPPSQMLHFVRSLVGKLKPGGFFLARFPNADSPFGQVNQNGDVTHLNAIGLGKVRYLVRELGVKLVFFGAQAVPVCGSMARSMRRFAGLTLFKVVDGVVNKVFFPNDPISFCSGNVVVIVQAIDRAALPSCL